MAFGRAQLYEFGLRHRAPADLRWQDQGARGDRSRAGFGDPHPTVAEAGYPALTVDGVVGLFGPPTVRRTIFVKRIAADIKDVMEQLTRSSKNA